MPEGARSPIRRDHRRSRSTHRDHTLTDGHNTGGTGEWFAATLIAGMELLVEHLPLGWTERRGDSFGLMTGIRIPNLNGVLCASPRVRTGDVTALLARVKTAGVPHCLQLRPGSGDELVALAQDAGMVRGDDVPAMVLEHPPSLDVAALAPALSVRRLTVEERGVHLAVAAEGFEVPAEVLVPLVEMLQVPQVRIYAGEVDGETVTTGVALRLADAVGIFNVATPPHHRGHGFGAAVTAHAVLEGFADGATRAFLQSSLMARPLYERLGFRTVEQWQLWVGE